MAIVKISDAGKGLNADLTPEELQMGVWSDAQNMRFSNGYAQRFNGLAPIFAAPTVEPYYITAFQKPNKRLWIHAGTQRVFSDDEAVRTEITRLAEIAISTLTHVTTTATLKTTAAHGLSTSDSVTIYGAYPLAYNGTFTITVTAPDTCTFTMASDPGANASIVGHLIGPGASTANFTGGRDDRWTGGVLAGIQVLNNGVDVPQYWTGDTNKLRTLPGWNTGWTAAVMVPWKNYLIALDITKSGVRNPHMIKWSVAAVPGSLPDSWDETNVTRDAGELPISDTADLLIDALPMGDALIIYKERSMYALRFIGAPYIFQVQRIPGDSGMLFRGCAVNTPLGHVVLTAGDVVLNNGQGVESIADGQIRAYIFRNLDSTNYKKAFVTSNPQKNEVLICFPFVGSTNCNKAAVWNWKEKTWGLRDLDGVTYGATGQIAATAFTTWDSDSESWDLDTSTWNEDPYSPNQARLLLSQTNRISGFDISAGDDGVTNLTGSLTRTGVSLDNAQSMKLVRSVYPRVDAPSGSVMTIQVGASMAPNAAPVWSAPASFVVGQDTKADAFANGRFLAFRFTCSAPWRMRPFDIDVEQTGLY